MSRVTGVYRNGMIVLDEPVVWEEGAHVSVRPKNADLGHWPRTPEEMAAWVQRLNHTPPHLDTREETDAFNKQLAESDSE